MDEVKVIEIKKSIFAATSPSTPEERHINPYKQDVFVDQ